MVLYGIKNEVAAWHHHYQKHITLSAILCRAPVICMLHYHHTHSDVWQRNATPHKFLNNIHLMF